MIVRFREMQNVGRFGGWDAQLSCRNEARLGRLSLIYGRNGAGKSTLVRVLTAAAAGAGLAGEKLLGAIGSPGVTIALAAGRLQHAGEKWTGPRPKLVAFDHEYIDKHVFVGRRTGKEQRRQLLDLALGARDVEIARELDALNVRGRELAKERREHEAAVDAAAHVCGLPAGTFLALRPLADEGGARDAAEAAHRAAVATDTLARLPRPEPLPVLPAVDRTAPPSGGADRRGQAPAVDRTAPPSGGADRRGQAPAVDLAKLETLLARERRAVGDEVAATVEAHLRGRLGGKGRAWVRDGLDHVDGETCPFCAQPTAGAPLIEMYRAAFDRAYDDLVAQIDAARAQLRELDTWWREVQRVGAANVRAFDGWVQLAQLVRPAFDSPTRKRQLDELAAGLAAILDAKRRDPGRATEASVLAAPRALAAELAAAVAAYNAEIARAGTLIAACVRDAGGGSVADARRRLADVEAAIRRHAPPIAAHVAELGRLDGELDKLKAAKEREVARLRTESTERLAAFAARMNRVLGQLGADFTLDHVRPERSGGAVAARFTLRCERGELEVATSRDEERLERVLSDGDRSALALAVFLIALEDVPDLAEHVIVFDDPMTSQDAERAQRTAELIATLAQRAAQVIVLAHDAPVLDRIAETWRRREPARAADVARLAQLDKDRRAIVPYDENAPQHARLAEGSAPTATSTASR